MLGRKPEKKWLGLFCLDRLFSPITFFFFSGKAGFPQRSWILRYKISPNGNVSIMTESTQIIEAQDFRSVPVRNGICCSMACQYLLFQYFSCVWNLRKLQLSFQPKNLLSVVTRKKILEGEMPGLCMGNGLLWKTSAVPLIGGVLHLVQTEEWSYFSQLPYYLNAERGVMGFLPVPFCRQQYAAFLSQLSCRQSKRASAWTINWKILHYTKQCCMNGT